MENPVALLLVFLVQSALSVDYKLVLYSEYNQAGDQLELTKNQADLAKVNFDNKAKSFCATGVWMFYKNVEYNKEGNDSMEFTFAPDNFCANLNYVAGEVSSVGYAGHSEDYKIDFIFLFRDTFFQGTYRWYYTTFINTHTYAPFKSLIINGKSPWTLYSEVRYEGTSVCLTPPGDEVVTPYFLKNTRGSNITFDVVKSLRGGCH